MVHFDERKLRQALAEGTIAFDSPCVVLEKAISRDQCIARMEADPAERDRLYQFTEVIDCYDDMRPYSMTVSHGPVLGADVFKEGDSSDWSRISAPKRLIDLMPDAVLLAACEMGDMALFDIAIDAGADIASKISRDWSPMKLAVANDQKTIVTRLLDLGWPGSEAFQGRWLLAPAVEAGFLETVDQLLSRHAIAEKELSEVLGYSFDVAMAERLLAGGAQPTKELYGGNTPIRTLLNYDAKKPEPLRLANAAELIAWYAEKGVDVALVDEFGGTALHTAVRLWHVPAITQLLKLGAPLEARNGLNSYQEGETPEEVASKNGHADEFRALVMEHFPSEPLVPVLSEARAKRLRQVGLNAWPGPLPPDRPPPSAEAIATRVTSRSPSASHQDKSHVGEAVPTPRLGTFRVVLGALVALCGTGLVWTGTTIIGGLLIFGGILACLSGYFALRQWQAITISPKLLSGEILAEDYPSRAARESAEGDVEVLVIVAKDGEVVDVSVIGSSGHPSLDQATCRLVKTRFRYQPALGRDGLPIEGYVSQSVHWRLD